MIKAWVEAMRLRTLPVSVAGVIAGIACAVSAGHFSTAISGLCLLVALAAQIASNFANEYYDWRDGLDKPGRVGPRRGVTEGDISPKSMLIATFIALSVACAAGLGLVFLTGKWWIIAVGVVIALGVLAYSTGPFPLSRHGLGELAVICFFGLVPVNFTAWLLTGEWTEEAFLISIAIGLMGANVLIVNNFRDMPDDAAVGKRTLAVIFGRTANAAMYTFNVVAGACLTFVGIALTAPVWEAAIPSIIYIAQSLKPIMALRREDTAMLNPMLGYTAKAMLLVAVIWLAISVVNMI